MTGLDPARDALLEVAVARVVGGVVVDRYVTLLRTEVPSVPGAAALHGIEPAAVLDAPDFADVAPRLDALLDGAVPVMHGVDLDVRFLDRAFADAGLTRRIGPAIDTLRLARRAVHARHYNLSALCGALGLEPVRWHRAGEDVRALVALFARLCAALAPVDPMDLWQVRAADGRVQVRAAIAKVLAEAVGTARPLRLVVRTPGHAERELTARVLWFRPPHVGLARVGAGLVPAILRADRVLRVAG
jgi:DNA polymerase-3 subunit epsilon